VRAAAARRDRRIVGERDDSASVDLLKECGRPECTQVYVDSSRGFRREWCAMATCGNKMNAPAHRARLRGNPPLTSGGRLMPPLGRDAERRPWSSSWTTQWAAAAAIAGLRVLGTTGAEAERNFAYDGSRQLPHPVRAGVAGLPAPQRDALRTALGLADGAEPGAYLVGLAAWTLPAEESGDRPLLVVAEDVHWLDRATVDVLAFVARRTSSCRRVSARAGTLPGAARARARGTRRWPGGSRCAARPTAPPRVRHR